MTEWHPLRPLETNESSNLWKDLDKSAEAVGRAIASGSPAKMPTLNHASMADFNNVYEPSDDTYLLIDTIKHDLFSGCSSDNGNEISSGETVDEEERLVSSMALAAYRMNPTAVSSEDTETDYSNLPEGIRQELEKNKEYFDNQAKKVRARARQLRRLEQIRTVMEIGTGSGVPITYLSKRLLAEKPVSRQHAYNGFSVVATDLNPRAVEFAGKTAEENGVVVSLEHEYTHSVGIRSVGFREMDLAGELLPDLSDAVDVLVFNPPYVPTEDSEIFGKGIEISWAGGQDGRKIIDRALPQIEKLLRKPDGVCYMITVDDNKPDELAEILRETHGLKMVPLVRRRARNEYLSVQKISWLPTAATTRP